MDSLWRKSHRSIASIYEKEGRTNLLSRLKVKVEMINRNLHLTKSLNPQPLLTQVSASPFQIISVSMCRLTKCYIDILLMNDYNAQYPPYRGTSGWNLMEFDDCPPSITLKHHKTLVKAKALVEMHFSFICLYQVRCVTMWQSFDVTSDIALFCVAFIILK